MVNGMKNSYVIGVPLSLVWLATCIVFYTANNPVTTFIAGLGVAVAGSGLGVILWYLIKKSWRIADRAILFGVAVGLYGLIASMVMYIYNVGGWRETNIVSSIIAGLLVPVRAFMLGEE